MAATGKVLGTVTAVVGEVKATAADGTVRILQVGDQVFSDEVITTNALGSVNIALENGKTLDCGGDTELALHESILGVATAASPATAAPGSDVAALQAAIAGGQDPSQVAPATAAGGAPAAGGGVDGGGGTPVIIDQANTTGVVTSGFPTTGDSLAFAAPEFQLLPIVPTITPPVVSVSVQVSVDVGNTPGEGGGTVPTHPSQVSVGSVPIVEGTDGETTRSVDFVIKLDKAFDSDVQVTYQIVSGPADAANSIDAAQTPSDYSGQLTGTVTIPAGQTEFVVTVEIAQDHRVENNENFSIVLTDAVNATIDPTANSAIVTIQDDDTAPVAHADTNWAQEDAHLTATGNVIAGQAHPDAPSGTFADAQDTDADGDIPHVTTTGTFQGSYGSLVLNADGSYTYSLNNGNAAVQGLDTGETLTDTFSYTASDGVNAPSSSSLSVTIFGTNDVPEITVKTGGDIFASGAEGTVSEAALAIIGSNPSSDGEFVSGSFKVADTDGVDDIDSVTINGQTVAVGSLVGATFDGDAGVITVTSYADGVANFTYELTQAVTDGEGEETDVFTLTTSDGTSTSAPATITITILDDVPSITVTAAAAADALTVDETNLAANATANFADNFSNAPVFGADGAGTVSSAYTLSMNAGGTGLVDTATGQTVALVMNGGAVEGRVSDGEGGFFVVFKVSVDASGNVTLDQQRAVMHTPDTGPDQSTSLSAADLVVLTRTDTITDKDGDISSGSASINIGTALSFEDDAPSITVSATQAADTLTVDETNLVANATASFADNFGNAPVFGADGAGTVSSAYTLSMNAGGTGLVDTATGQTVALVMNGGAVEGRVSDGEGGFFVVFKVSVDASGNVTLDQQRAVMHTPDTGPDQSTSLSAADLVVLTRTDTITDKDGDTSSGSASINIGTALSFEDDGPSFTIVNDGADEDTAVSIATPNPATDTTYVGQFADWNYGADMSQAVPTLSNVSGSVTINGASTSNSLILDLKDSAGVIAAKLTLNADGTDSIQVIHRAATTETDTLLTSDVTAEGPSLVKTINSSISGLVITITGNDGNSTPNEATDQVNPSTQGWAIKDNQIDKGESITFSFNETVERFSFVTDGFTGNPSGGDVGLTIRLFYDAGHTIFQDFTGINVVNGGSVQVADLTGFGQNGVYSSIYGVNVLSDNSQDSNDGFRLNNVAVSKISTTPAPDLDYSFTVNILDKDGDSAAQSFSVHLDGDTTSGGLVLEANAGTSGADVLTGAGANDVLIGGGGHDVLTGGAGSDTFKFTGTLDANSSDTVTDFNVAPVFSGGDVLDLHDVLPAAAQGQTTEGALGAYISVQTVGSDTVVSVDSDGAGGAVAVQVVTLQGITGVTLADLLSNSQIHT